MYITETVRTAPNGTTYRCVLLRQSYREGSRVKNRTIANLSHCTLQEVEAIRLALQHKDDLAVLGTLHEAPLHEGRSVGAVWVIYDMARRLGIEAALGKEVAGQLALWQVIARVLDQGSRLSAVRLAASGEPGRAVWPTVLGPSNKPRSSSSSSTFDGLMPPCIPPTRW